MAKAKTTAEDSSKKPKRLARKNQTVRQRAQASTNSRPKRFRKSAGKITQPLKKASAVGKKEFHMPLPDNRIGGLLSKRVRFPRFLREAWHEIRLVTWPNARDTFRLTMAVFIFSVVFATIVGILDYGLGKLFREVIIK